MGTNHNELLQKISKVGVTYKQVNKIKSQLIECAVIKFNSDQSDIFLARVLNKRRFSHIDYLDHVQDDKVFSFFPTSSPSGALPRGSCCRSFPGATGRGQHNTNLES